jgi:hypothetical protein
MSTISSSTTTTTAYKVTADTTGVLAFQTGATPTTNMTLDASGNLGVGSTSPNIGGLTRALTINTPTGGNYSGVELAGAGTLSARFITNNAAGTYIGSQVSIPLVFETNATERARIDSSGNLLVGGTTTTNINTNGGFAALFASGQAYTSTGHVSGTGSGSYYHACYYNNSIVGGITQVGTSGVVLTSVSDYRLKDDVTAMQDSLSKVLALNPVTYKWKSDGSDGEGFIAHEIQSVIPTAATGEKDEVDDDGNAKYQGINLSAVVPHLVKAIQELNAKVTALENK